MENYYVITGSQFWKGGFNIHFFEIINEDDYQKYMAAKEILGIMLDTYGFGINEDWEDDLNYLGFEPQKITKEQHKLLNELKISGEEVIGSFYCRLNDLLNDAEIDIDVYEASLDEFKEALKNYSLFSNETL